MCNKVIIGANETLKLDLGGEWVMFVYIYVYVNKIKHSFSVY